MTEELFDDMRSSATLTRTDSGDGWVFSHNTLREFLVARAMVDGLIDNRPINASVPISPVMSEFVASLRPELMDQALAKLGSFWQARHSHANAGHYLSLFWNALWSGHGDRSKIIAGDQSNVLMLDRVRLSGLTFDSRIITDKYRVVMDRSEISECSFLGLDLSRSDFSESVLDNNLFVRCNLGDAKFDNSFLFETNFTDCEFRGASFRGLDESSCVGVSLHKDFTSKLEGREVLGFLSFQGGLTDKVTDFEKLAFHPKINIIEKILDRLSNQRNCQLRGLTQRGEAQKDPPFARQFVEILHQNNWTRPRGNMIGLTPLGREMVSKYFEGHKMPEKFVAFLQANS